MKQSIAIAVCLLASLAAVSASAQDHAVKATVPFGFYVGNTWAPAGTYVLGADAQNPSAISIRNADSGQSLISLARREDHLPGADKLVLKKYGDRYFLHAISSRNMNVEFPRSKKERSAETREASAEPPSTIYLALTEVPCRTNACR